jgi:Ni,Fe-hydrogenase III small subunit/formate hydrogenlyase subunit 6/NADH:ubiquinone oxidoreductase subunit I
MFSLIAKSLAARRVTERDPFAAPQPFGFPVIDFARCTLCAECVAACPTGAITVREESTRARRLTLSYAACTACRECVTACGEGAIAGGRQPGIVACTRGQLQQEARFEAGERGWTFQSLVDSGEPSLERTAAALRERVRRTLGRSLHVRQVDAGSCNGCELEIAAMSNPVYDLERFGIHLVASPRHADVLLVTGPVTRNMEQALRRTYEATPEPRIVVAIGACGCSGGIFGEGTYASVGAVDRVIPVDLYVPGCPPRPQAILAGLLTVLGRLPYAG